MEWCALNWQCDNDTPVEDWFFEGPGIIRQLGDIPQGLVEVPINPDWVLDKMPAKTAFWDEGLIDYGTMREWCDCPFCLDSGGSGEITSPSAPLPETAL